MKLIRIFLAIVIFFNIGLIYCFAEHVKVKSIDEINEIISQDGKITLYGVSLYKYSYLVDTILKDKNSSDIGLRQFFGNADKAFGDYDFAISYRDAIRLMDNLLTDKNVEAFPIANTNKYIIIKNDVNINLLLIELGYAAVDKPGLVGDSIDDKLFIAENNARTSKKGIWGVTGTHLDKTEFTRGDGQPPSFSVKDGMGTFIIAILVLGYSYIAIKKDNLNIMWLFLNFTVLVIWWYGTPYDLNWFNAALRIGLFILVFIALIAILLNFVHNKNLTFIKLIACIMLITLFIALSFSALYYYISNSQSKLLTEYTYDTTGGTQFKRGLFRPETNYIEVPKDCYQESDSGVYYYLNPRDALYFSAATLFTVGYGDMVPKGNLKNWVMLEMLIGEILRLSIFAYLVSKVKFDELSLRKVDRFIILIKILIYKFLKCLKS